MFGSTFITLDRASLEPLGQQIYQQIFDAVNCGQLRPGDRLVSSRSMATDLCCSRNTVKFAYEQLHAEGIIETIPRKGTFVIGPADSTHK